MELTKPFYRDYIIFDMETTAGKYPDIIQISALKYNRYGKEVAQFDRYISDVKPVSEKARNITGITTEFLRSAGVPEEEVIKGFHQFIGHDVLVGHNIKGSDIPKLNKSFEKYGLAPMDNDFMDTYHWAQHIIEHVPSYGLEALSHVLQIGQTEFHNALADCYTTKYLMDYLIKYCPQEGYNKLPKHKPEPIGLKVKPYVSPDKLAFYIEIFGNTAELTMNRWEPSLKYIIELYSDIYFKSFIKKDKNGDLVKISTVVVKDVKRDLRSFLEEFPGCIKILKKYNRWVEVN